MVSESLKVEIAATANRCRNWMLESSFPFWAEHSVNPDGGFYERIDLNAIPIKGEDSRVRLQARMAYTFALAARLGWDRKQAQALAERGLAVLINDCCRDDGLYGRRVQPGVGMTDDGAEAYDTAFALLAFATAYHVFKLPVALEAGNKLNAAIDDLLRRPENEGGYRERLPEPQQREQNPHMHLTESSLAWFEATGDKAALVRAEELAGFVEDKFFDAETGLLLEFAEGNSDENRIEAGHLFEWVWILGRIRDLGGNYPEAFANALFDSATKLIEGQDFIPLSQHLDRTTREDIQRTWGPTEALKGQISIWPSRSNEQMARQILDTANGLWDDHVANAIPGAWIDKITSDRASAIEDITPATGYHIYLAFEELIEFSNGLGDAD